MQITLRRNVVVAVVEEGAAADDAPEDHLLGDGVVAGAGERRGVEVLGVGGPGEGEGPGREGHLGRGESEREARGLDEEVDEAEGSAGNLWVVARLRSQNS